MRYFIGLFMILASTVFAFAQSPIEAGDNCFDKGDYVCAQEKYQGAMNTATGRDKHLAEIRYTRAKSCGDWLAEADNAFNNSNYKLAKENYQSVLNENLNDSYAQTQLEKCNNAIRESIWLEVSKKNLDFSSLGGKVSIGVNTNATSYKIIQYPPWCTVQGYNTYFEISYTANTDTITRTGWFKIKAGEKEVEIYATQAPKPNKQEITLSVSKEFLSFNEEKQLIYIDVNTNASDYQITNMSTWCQVKSKSSNSFLLECNANYSTSSREDWFNVKAGDKTVKISLRQTGAKINQKSNIIPKDYKTRKSDYSFFAIGYEGGQIAPYGFRMEFGGRSFIGMFLNVRSSIISDEEILLNYGYLENRNEGVIGLNFRISRWAYLNLGGGYGFSQVLKTSETLMQVEYIPVYGGLTFRLGRRVNLSGGASFRDIDINVDEIDPEFTLGLTINLKR